MEFRKSEDGKTLCVALIGEIDAANVNKIEETVLRESRDVSELIFDLEKLEYIISAGLRFLLKMRSRMK